MVAFAGACSSCQTMPSAPASDRQTEHVLRLSGAPGGELRYLLYCPLDYEKTDRLFPLILFMHGAGESGRSLPLVKREGLPRDLEHWLHFPFVVVSPQIAKGAQWPTGALSDLLDEIQRDYRIDPHRVSLTGLSSGAVAALELAIRFPGRFAAVAAVTPQRLPEGDLCAIGRTPVRVFHNRWDERVPLGRSGRLVRALKVCGVDARLIIFEENTHDAWTRAYHTGELYDWLLEQRR